VTRLGKSFLVLVVVFLLALGAAPLARADLVLVTQRSALGGTDSLVWGTLGPEFTTVGSPFDIVSTHGLTVEVNKPTGDFERRDQLGASHWDGNFAPGDTLIWNGPNGTGGPVTVTFPVPINAGGAQIQNMFLGAFTAQLEAFDTMGNLLGAVTETGNSTTAADNSAIFLGVQDTNGFQIGSLRFSLTAGTRFGDQNFALNQFDFNATAASPPIPEPGSVALGLGLLGLAGYGWRRCRGSWKAA
jgi:PEP-CTERM motif